MTKKLQMVLSRLLLVCALLVLAVVFHMVLVVPKAMSQASDMARQLSAPEKFVYNLSGICITYWILIIPILVFIVIGAIIWVMVSRIET